MTGYLAALPMYDWPEVEQATDRLWSYLRAALQDHGFHPPLDIVDGAARIVDPILDGINTGRHMWGAFLKDYAPTTW